MEPSGAHSSDAFKISGMTIEEMSSRITRLSDLIPHISKLVRIQPNDSDEIYDILKSLRYYQGLKEIDRLYNSGNHCEILKMLPKALKIYYKSNYRNLCNIKTSSWFFAAKLEEAKEVIFSILPEEKSLPYLLEQRLEVLQKCHEDLEDFLSHDHTIRCQQDLLGNDDTIPKEFASTKLIRIIDNISELVTLALEALKDNPENLDLKELETHIIELDSILMKSKQLGIESDSEENEPEIEIFFEGTETDQETEIESEPEDITTAPTSLTQTTAEPAASKQNKGSSHFCIIL